MLYNRPQKRPYYESLVEYASCPSLPLSSHSLILSHSVSSMQATSLSLLSIKNKQTSMKDHFTVLVKHRNSRAHIFMYIHTNMHLCPYTYTSTYVYAHVYVYLYVYVNVYFHVYVVNTVKVTVTSTRGKLRGISDNSSTVQRVEEPLKFIRGNHR